MDNEQNQNPTGDEQNRVAELESQLAATGEELVRANARISELEQAAAGDSERLNQLEGSLARAVSNYKTLVVQSNPDVLKELITGDSVEAIGNSLVKARELIGKVKSGIEAEISSTRVPAGAPQRTSLGSQALSSREKIQQALGGHH